MPNIDTGSIGKMISLEKKYPDLCYSMIGLHPTSVRADYKDQLERIGHYLNENRFIAIGEIGIDLYWDKTFAKEQTEAFKMQVGLALSKNLPVVIHSREAFDEIFKSLEEFRGSGIKGVFHAFSGSVDQAGEAIKMGFKIGVGGIVTFKNSGLDLTVKDRAEKFTGD